MYPILPKIFEKLAHKRMISFINRLNLQNNNQFDFLAGKTYLMLLANL